MMKSFRTHCATVKEKEEEEEKIDEMLKDDRNKAKPKTKNIYIYIAIHI